MSIYKDLVGLKFNRLIVLKYHSHNKHKQIVYLCKCDCGVEKLIAGTLLTTGHTKSCGCLNREKIIKSTFKHGLTDTPLHKNWLGMIGRCKYKSHISYKYYGAKGIKVCDEWLNSFITFYEWAMKNGYDKNKSIDRIDSNKDYSPDNCKWSTRKEQNYNKTNNLIVEIEGKMLNSKEVFEIYGINNLVLSSRIIRGKKGLELIKTPRKTGRENKI